MEVITFVLRIIIFVIFFSSGFQKLKEIESHKGVIEDYRILPTKFVPLFARIEPVLEILSSICIFLSFFFTVNLYICIFLLIMYSLAVIINLIRGRREISCGCGGIVGKHNLSWWIVFRNLLLIISCTALLKQKPVWFSLDNYLREQAIGKIFSLSGWLCLFSVVLILLIYLCAMDIRSILKKMNIILTKRRI
jgi:uncharacterized membrane protein YphA (DoxX/SURF4 family)